MLSHFLWEMYAVVNIRKVSESKQEEGLVASKPLLQLYLM